MEREDVKACFDLLNAVESCLGSAPHRDAVAAERSLNELRNIIGQDIPGGGYEGDDCEFCEEPLGIEEAVRSGDVLLCQPCYDKAVADQAAEPAEPAAATPS